MSNEVKLFEDGLEQYSKASILLENFFMFLWVAIGTISCWFFNPIIAIIYLVYALLMIIVILRKLICPNCYYYGKNCHVGWGKLTSTLFKKGDIKKFESCKGMKIPPGFYGSLTMVPLILLIISMVVEFSFLKLLILIALVLLIIYSGAISRKKSCSKCKMKLICSGSAAK